MHSGVNRYTIVENDLFLWAIGSGDDLYKARKYQEAKKKYAEALSKTGQHATNPHWVLHVRLNIYRMQVQEQKNQQEEQKCDEKVNIKKHIDEIMRNPELIIKKDPCILLVGLFEIGDERVSETLLQFLRQGFLSGESFYSATHSRAEFIRMILDNKFWPTKQFSEKEITGAANLKKNILSMILDLEDEKLRQRALWQALVPETLLGNIFNIKRGRWVPSLLAGQLKEVIRRLEEMIVTSRQHIFIDKDTVFMLRSNANEPLRNDLELYFPALFWKLVQYGVYPVVSRARLFGHVAAVSASKCSETPQLSPVEMTELGVRAKVS